MENQKTKKKLVYVWLLVASYSSTLGNPLPLQSSWTSNQSTASVSESLTSFAKLIQNVSCINSLNNQVISPLSLFAALSMASVGAKGSTLNQIQQVLRLPPDALIRNGAFAKLMMSLTAQNSEDVEMEASNFIWVPRGLAIKAEYARSIQDIFQTRVRDADFSRVEDVRHLINERVEKMTRGNIKEIFPQGSIARHTRLLMANALYFRGRWIHTFNRTDTFTQPFYTANGKSVKVQMMHGSSTYQAGVFDNLQAKAILMPYQGYRYGLLCVLPDRNIKLSELETRMSTYGLTPTLLLRKMIQRDVNVTFPKFNIQFEMEMSNVFRKMGILDLFSNQADLSGMSSSSRSAALRVSSIYHQATIEVNEGGSEATAATGFEITPLIGGIGKHTGPIEFHADRPFLFYLIDRDNNNIPLIMGRIHNPLQSRSQSFKNTQCSEIDDRSYSKTVRNRLDLPFGLESNSLTFNEAITGSDRQPTDYIHQTDHVIYPQTPVYFSNHFKSAKKTADRYTFHSPSVQTHHNPIIFPDEIYDGRRLKRESAFNMTTESEVSKSSPEEDIGVRIKDPLWFNKPTAAEVIIPINTRPESSRKPTLSQSAPLTPGKQTKLNETKVTDSVRPQFKPTLPELTTTARPFTQTAVPNIFDTLTPSPPKPNTAFPVSSFNGVWNPSDPDIPGAPGFPPVNIGISGPSRPEFVPPWFQSPINSNFQPFSLSNSGIFFPEYRFSSLN